jgi:hypothetical protein
MPKHKEALIDVNPNVIAKGATTRPKTYLERTSTTHLDEWFGL